MIIIDNIKIKKVYNNNSSISKIFIFKSDELILKYDKNNLMTDLIIKYEDFNKAILTEDFLYLKQSTKDKEYYQINISDISTYEEARIIDLIKRNNIVISNKKINNKDVID